MKRDFLDSKKRWLCISPVFCCVVVGLFVVVVILGLFVVFVCYFVWLFREEDHRSQEVDGFLHQGIQC